ncbi:hypothetical protein [Poritiphilus flavus]|uniref:Lipoprotein n=1 Tax=Poritiphilus flavus TaxID=2697053 RepID=A0A6L9E8V3_9FLAO|nr:hypothetical protein [Poritiphilus flavus]NAS10998.1 hypothetical protein [Poritiphilus flavus]
MKRLLLCICLSIGISSCIPIRIAPNIKDYKITKGKKFKRGLPKKTMFIFEDPKDADDFYHYVNTKFQLDDYYVDVQVPFEAGGSHYYFSFYEVEIPDKAINLFPLIFDVAVSAAVGSDEVEPIMSDDAEEILRNGNYYIGIEVFNDEEKDCLAETSLSRPIVLKYLRELKKEYLATDNYNEIVFKN